MSNVKEKNSSSNVEEKDSTSNVEEKDSTFEMAEEESQRPARTNQYLAAISASMGAMAVGAAIGYSSPASASFRCDNVTLDDCSEWWYMSEAERGWFAGSLSIGALLGCLVAGVCINKLGRKGTMLLSVIPLLVGWILVGLAQNFTMMIIGRVLGGLTTGISSLVVPTYTTEYASKDIRGALGSGFQLFITMGILYAYVAGVIVDSWQWLTMVCGVLGIVFFVLVAFLKESPNYLMAKGKEMEARKSMQYFRGPNYNIDKEMEELKQSLEEAANVKISMQDLTQPYIMKPLAITLALMAFQQLAGVNAVVYNIVVIFKDSGTNVSEGMSTIIVGVVQVIATAASTLLLDRVGRRILLCLSAGIMAVSITCLGVFFYLKSMDPETTLSTLSWLPLTSLIVFISAFSIGYGPIPWLMMGELFYPGVKEMAGSMATTLNWTFVFIVTFTFEPLQSVIHDYGTYWLFGGLCTLSFVFCLLFVPETKGKSLKETMTYFGGPVS